MFTSRFTLPAAWLLLSGTALAAPPSESVAAGTSATDGAPPVPTDENGANAFVSCSNPDGPFKPFCLPKQNDVYYPETMHYVTWDTSHFPGHNTTLQILGFYADLPSTKPGPPANSGVPPPPPEEEEELPQPTVGEELEAFNSDDVSAAWGFWRWRPEKWLLKNHGVDAANITLRIVALPGDGRPARWYSGPTVTVRYKPRKPKKYERVPTHADDEVLYIALPLVFGFAAVMIIGTFCWSRQLRQFGVGSAMGRANTRGFKRFGASRKDRARNRDKELSIRLMESGGAADSDDERWSHGSSSASAGKRVFERVDRKED
ncbi:hypothetical protein C7999DRAFT_10496 [Corynascus novoguineensis]|uniref:Secreted protein n=1 Tax=Corynascus novoguineensis TaxID=1126955 RepID=A0AAN7HUZ7_9PEZI|nr:hypothetical protein C7999DRAFT_10496 [Corynascus novoguineensis]